MSVTIQKMIEEARQLPQVSIPAITAYKNRAAALAGYVDEALVADERIHQLIGHNPLQAMYDNHRHHAAFMATVFSTGFYEMLARTVPWVYRTYHAHKFSYDYFPLELSTWIKAIDAILIGQDTEAIKAVYRWLLDSHEEMILLAQQERSPSLAVDEKWLPRKLIFQETLMTGDHRKCLAMAMDYISSPEDIEQFHRQVLQPIMYDVGILWEEGRISVAQEHLVSAVVGRVLATVSTNKIVSTRKRGKAVVTASVNEFHEIGAWMISDILELDGWEIQYLGCNTPRHDLIGLLRSFSPHLLCLSVSMPFNIDAATETIEAIREIPELDAMRIMIGGRVFNEYPALWEKCGADGYAADISAAKQLARQWQENRKHAP